jgi:hypothetical protein
LAPFSFHKNPFNEFILDFVFVIQVAKTRQKKTPIAQLSGWQFESVKREWWGQGTKDYSSNSDEKS